jgi:hypothetical protein
MLKIICNCTSSNICCRSRDCYIHYIYNINLLWIKDSNFVWSWYDSLIWCWGSKKNNLIFYWWAWQLPCHIFSPEFLETCRLSNQLLHLPFFSFLKQICKKREKGGGHVEEDEDFLCFSWGVRSVVSPNQDWFPFVVKVLYVIPFVVIDFKVD